MAAVKNFLAWLDQQNTRVTRAPLNYPLLWVLWIRCNWYACKPWYKILGMK